MRLISLGRACETAFQIRMHTPKYDADFFDWLITPVDAVIAAIRNDFADQLNSEDLYLQDDKNFVVNRITEIKYGHVFKRDEKGDIDSNILADLPRVTSIFQHLKDKFLSYSAQGQPVGFVRRDLTPDQAKELASTIRMKYPTLDFTIVAVNDSKLGVTSTEGMRMIEMIVPVSGHDGLGHADEWAAELCANGLTASPFVRTKDEVFHRVMVHQTGDVRTLIEEAKRD